MRCKPWERGASPNPSEGGELYNKEEGNIGNCHATQT